MAWCVRKFCLCVGVVCACAAAAGGGFRSHSVYRTASSIAGSAAIEGCICAKRFLCRYSGHSAIIQGVAIEDRRLYPNLLTCLVRFSAVLRVFYY